MSAELFYGSSEYSPQAEELFARYIQTLEAGGGPGFEEYCALHPELADELLGLHTDWDNVRGLLSKMKDLGQGDGVDASEPDSCEREEVQRAPVAAGKRAPRRRWLLASLSLLALLTLGAWNRKLVHGQQVLAEERDQIAAQELATARQLQESKVEGQRLLERERTLDQELGAERSQKERLKQAHSALIERDERLQSEHQKLGQEYRQLGEEVNQLEASNAHLSRSVESERLALGQARAAAQEHKRGLDALAALTELGELLNSEPEHWPASYDLLAELQIWLVEARRVQERQASIVEPLAERASSSAVLGSMLLQLESLTSAGGRIERARRRLESLLKLQADPTGAKADAWAAARLEIANQAQAPHYFGLQMKPQFGLLPLGSDSITGLWQFADLSTGRAATADDGPEGMLFWLIPGSGVDTPQQKAFLLLAALPSAQQLSFAGLEPLAGESQLDEQALRKFGLTSPSERQLELLSVSGLEPAAWAGMPVRELED